MQASSLERYSESTQRAESYWSTRHRETAGPGLHEEHFHGLSITISREAGTPGTSVAQELGRRLAWTVYDYQLVEKIAKEMGVRLSQLQNVDERKMSWIVESLVGMSSGKPITESNYIRHLVESVFDIGRQGKCVLVGRGTGYILPAATTLRVRLIGELDDRIAFAGHRLNLPPDQAREWIESRERQRIEFVKAHFNRDPSDARDYDLVLNTSRWTVAECANLVVAALRDFETHPAAQRALGNIANKQ
ncbi:MAG TPA: cytidylate kinase-like family protein [Pirellulales bacterium]|jgi:cytidylate kinase|nr:cytidylate kinase-like family protein [Pirellulales bacterium]